MKCPKCGVEYEGNFCPNCGKKPKKPISKRRKFISILLIVIGIYVLVIAATSWKEEIPDTSVQLSQSEGTEQEDKEKVNYENFEKIQSGMTYQQVVEIFGEEGEILSEAEVNIGEEYKTTLYYWYDNTGIANCNVTIQNGKVIAKAQVGLQ